MNFVHRFLIVVVQNTKTKTRWNGEMILQGFASLPRSSQILREVCAMVHVVVLVFEPMLWTPTILVEGLFVCHYRHCSTDFNRTKNRASWAASFSIKLWSLLRSVGARMPIGCRCGIFGSRVLPCHPRWKNKRHGRVAKKPQFRILPKCVANFHCFNFWINIPHHPAHPQGVRRKVATFRHIRGTSFSTCRTWSMLQTHLVCGEWSAVVSFTPLSRVW